MPSIWRLDEAVLSNAISALQRPIGSVGTGSRVRAASSRNSPSSRPRTAGPTSISRTISSTTDRRWVIDFCSKLAASDLEVTWTCSSRTDTLDEEQIHWLRQAGCRNIYFGVETGTADMQKAIAKDLDLDEAQEIIGKTVASGIAVTVGFIAGLPGESSETLQGTLREGMRFLSLPQSTVHLFGYSPYRGSVNYERICDDLVFDPHFVDFPLGEDTHRENCSLMMARLNLFSRYSWPNSYRDLDLGVVRTAEEFFPIVNALRPVFITLSDRHPHAGDHGRRAGAAQALA